MKVKQRKPIVIKLVITAVIVVVGIPAAILIGSKLFTAQEHAVRTDWSIDAGDTIDRDAEWGITFAQAQLGDGLLALHLIPEDIEEEGFTYYDLEVQQRLSGALENLKELSNVSWIPTTPLAILNPFGTGSNGLYLYFQTDLPTQVSYTIHVDEDGIPDFTAAASSDGKAYTKTHEFQLIGLVPGKTNLVTLTLTGSWGNVRQIITAEVDMPQPQSNYAVSWM